MTRNRILKRTGIKGISETTEANQRLKYWLAFAAVLIHSLPYLLRSP